MDQRLVSRKVYVGANVVGNATIRGMKAVKCNDDGNMYVMDVPSIAHYESGCSIHAECWGHMCRTPTGIMLPPQSMSMRNGDITTEYLKASKAAFNNNKAEYMTSLESTNFTKDGTMRSIMSSPVIGSCRLIATNFVYKRDVVAISANLASKLKIPYIHVDSEGVADPVYKERCLQEGDYVQLIRPPPLTIWNVQPLQVVFWDADCAGVHTETFTLLHGDFDGDEVHFLAITDENAIAECKSWETPVYDVFDKARQRYIEDGHYEPYDDIYWHRYEFVETTTTSAKRMLEGVVKLSYGNDSRNKDSNMEAMHKRFNDDNVATNFVTECIRGMKDICTQQLSQGQIGDMTRVAKIAAMCFYRTGDGVLHVSTNEGVKDICHDGNVDPGVPSVRAVMLICAVAQQAALDAHRVQEGDMSSHDFVSDMMLSRAVIGGKPGVMKTLVVFNNSIPVDVLSKVNVSWKYEVNGEVYALCKPKSIRIASAMYVIGAYNPCVLSVCAQVKRNTHELCKKGILTVCGYYNITLTHLELTDLAYVMSYKVEASADPITSRHGMLYRDLSWVETLEATDITKLKHLPSHWQEPNTSTSASFMGNFSALCDQTF